jgi:hypothetical protein
VWKYFFFSSENTCRKDAAGRANEREVAAERDSSAESAAY